MNPKVDFYFTKASNWQTEINKLRSIILDCGLNEDLKWGCPCYSFETANIVLIHVFNDYCALLFFKGALLKDDANILIQQTENVQAARQMRFTNIKEITKMERTIKAYIFEAAEVEKKGLKVNMKTTAEYKIPAELQQKFDKNPVLKNAFNALTPGRQRGYILYFSAAKQPKTRELRIEKYIPDIFAGKGLND